MLINLPPQNRSNSFNKIATQWTSRIIYEPLKNSIGMTEMLTWQSQYLLVVIKISPNTSLAPHPHDFIHIGILNSNDPGWYSPPTSTLSPRQQALSYGHEHEHEKLPTIIVAWIFQLQRSRARKKTTKDRRGYFRRSRSCNQTTFLHRLSFLEQSFRMVYNIHYRMR